MGNDAGAERQSDVGYGKEEGWQTLPDHTRSDQDFWSLFFTAGAGQPSRADRYQPLRAGLQRQPAARRGPQAADLRIAATPTRSLGHLLVEAVLTAARRQR